jgi:hypothetical protein
VPAWTFEASAIFALANAFASCSLRKVSVARACERFPTGPLGSNETYHFPLDLLGRGPRFISLSDCARPAGGRFRPFSVTALQLRINCLAGPLKHGGYLDDCLAGLEEIVQFLLLVDGPWLPCCR